jgi:hypothetical protein
MYLASSGFAQGIITDTVSLTLDTVSGSTGYQTTDNSPGVRYVRAPGGYIYNGDGFGGSIFVGPRFRQTNPSALRNENNGIEHGNNLGLFPSGSNINGTTLNNSNFGLYNNSSSTIQTNHKGTMLRKGRTVRLNRHRINAVKPVYPTSL